MDLEELNEPFFKAVNKRLTGLLSRDPTRYLHPSKRWEYPWALQQSAPAPGVRVLDAGCGGSIFPMLLSCLGLEVFAFDLHPVSGLAGHEGAHVHYATAGLTSLPFRQDSFDAIFCISVLEHLDIPSMHRALQELRRVLRPGGRLLLTTDYYRDRRARIRYSGPGAPFDVDWNFFDREMLEEVVLKAPGLRVRGDVDLHTPWELTEERMKRFHGYPYASVGVALEKVTSNKGEHG